MSRLLLVLVFVASCGGSSKPPPTAPLPPDEAKQAVKPPAAAAGDKASSEEEKRVAQPASPRPTGPIEIKIPAAQPAVKLVSDGKGKKQPLRYTAKAGTKQLVEVAMDFAGKQDAEAESVVPTIVLTGDAETRSIDPDGTAAYMLTVTSADVRAVPGSQVDLAKFKAVLGQLAGLKIAGTRRADGTPGELTLRLDSPPEHGEDALQLIRFTFPALPVLPSQAVGVGARWQATTAAKLADKLDVTQVTDYELVAHDGATWKIKGTTKVSGKDQEIDGAKISAITGTGSSETSIIDGALYPTHKSSLDAQFSVSDGDKSAKFALRTGGAFTPR
ncbi:MAG TPA: hypothetical protein VF469_16340 [Kofleriaceae bacterium]